MNLQEMLQSTDEKYLIFGLEKNLSTVIINYYVRKQKP